MKKINIEKEPVCALVNVPQNASAEDLVEMGIAASTAILQQVRDCTARPRENGGPISIRDCIGCPGVRAAFVRAAETAANKLKEESVIF